MKHTLTFFILITFCSCGQNSASIKKAKETASTTTDTVSLQDKVRLDSIPNITYNKQIEPVENEINELTMDDWRKEQDSMRNEILKRKPNKFLKESFLQEMYIRNVATVSNDSLFVTIPFDLHGADCIAPDGYSTDISFNFKLADTLIFPEILPFQEHEYGSVDKERKLSGKFQLEEQTDKHVIYHCAKYKRTLVLFRTSNESGTVAYFFTGVGQKRINGKNVYKIMGSYNEDDKNSLYPFTSTTLLNTGYEIFLR
jgi:hypothetical protein